MVTIADAKKAVGKMCSLSWMDRAGMELSAVTRIHDVTFVPLYGGYVITDTEDVRLDKVTAITVMKDEAGALGTSPQSPRDVPVAA